MIVLRRRVDNKALNVSYTVEGALFYTTINGNFVAFKNATLNYKPGSQWVNIEGDTRMDSNFYTEELVPKTFLTLAEERELSSLETQEKTLKERKETLSRDKFFRLKDLKKQRILQNAEFSIAKRARALNYTIREKRYYENK